MITEPVMLHVPEGLYRRLEKTARAMRRSLEEVLLHTLQVGSPPAWDDAPPELQAELAALDRLDDDALWTIARGNRTAAEMSRYDELLERNRDGTLSGADQVELQALRAEADQFMLRKAHAAALLRWRGSAVVAP